MNRCWGQKSPTMMPTDCFVLRTPTILPAIRISWCLCPTFIGAGLKVILPPVCKHTCFQTFWPWHHEYRLSQYLLKKFFRVTISYVKVTFISISYNEYIGSLMEQGEIKRNSRKIWLFWKVLYLVMFPKRGFSNNSL